jgi:hypothetical protein
LVTNHWSDPDEFYLVALATLAHYLFLMLLPLKRL